MKRIFIYRILAVLVTASIFIAACTKEKSDVRLTPTLSTTQVLNVRSDSATVVGFVVAEGDGFTEKGVCYNTATAPTIANSKVAYSGQNTTAAFNVKLSGLNYATKYYVRAYATNAQGTIYGEEFNFTTLPVVPTLTTAAITAITGNAATGGGNVTVFGGATVTARGVYYGTSHNPTLTDSKTVDGSGTGAFVSALTSLKGKTIYYVRSYATNSAGTGYGPEVSFTTLVDLPVVTTTAVTGITKIAAVSGGEVTYDGGGTITARGLAWSVSASPTITGSVIAGGTGTGVFTSNLTGLTIFTTYHVRAYATNSAGTAYGSDISFTTLADITKFYLVGDYNGWANNANALYIISTMTSGGTAEGYVNISAAGGLKLTTDFSWDNAHTYGDDGSGKLTNPGGNISVPAAGYYLVKANLGTMTYSLTATIWGLIGDATPGGWGAQTDMTYNSTLQTFALGLHLTSGSIKFRGTSDWGVNYGSTAADGKTLDAGGSNIAVATAGDYAITLDLSHPNAYTYSANTWGLIGDATSGGWNTDTPMTWDATNKVFTATLNLTAGTTGYKFRANAGWDLNYGGALNALSAGGANLSVATAGNYTITFDPWNLVATIVKN